MLAALATAAVLARSTGCQTNEIRQHDEVVYGHFSAPSAARALRRHLARAGFDGVKIENDGCGDFEVEQDGADAAQQRSSVAAEAKKAGFLVTFEQIGAPLSPPKGQVYGVFAREPSVTRANAFMQRLAGNSFQYVDLVRSAGKWLVVLPQVPVKSALSIAKEAARAGFRLQFFH